jgi:hypothetical protein
VLLRGFSKRKLALREKCINKRSVSPEKIKRRNSGPERPFAVVKRTLSKRNASLRKPEG